MNGNGKPIDKVPDIIEKYSDNTDLLQTITIEWRFMIMIDNDHGLVEMSKLLQQYKVPHVIHGFDGRIGTLRSAKLLQTNLVHDNITAKLAKFDQCDEGYYKDKDILRLYNDNPEEIPVLLSNSSSPEGFNVYKTSNLFVAGGDKMTPLALEQALGRINRMCNQTTARKKIIVYSLDENKTCPRESDRIESGYIDSELYDKPSITEPNTCSVISRQERSRSENPYILSDGPFYTS